MAARTPIFVASLVVSFLGFAAPVVAAPATGGSGPEQEACAGRTGGDACSLPNNQLGTCAASTCNRLDYSGGSPPKAIEEPCFVCKAPGASAHDGPPMLGGDGGAASDPAPAADTGSKSDTSGKEPPESASRCGIDDRHPGPAGLAMLGLGMLVYGGRRRSRATRTTVRPES